MMNEEITDYRDMNEKLIFLLGFSTAFLLNIKDNLNEEDTRKLEWLIEEIDQIIYHKNKQDSIRQEH